MKFNTVDGFQGREVDILLLSRVRVVRFEAPMINSSNLGFVADVRWMNVFLTRAKLSLWILGNSRTLQTNQTWACLVEDAKQRNLIILGIRPYSPMFKFASKNRPASSNSENKSSMSRNIEKVEAANQHVETQKKIVKHTSERKRKIGIETQTVTITGEGDRVFPLAKDATKDNKRRVRDKRIITI
ncbi:unnamed protein product [Fraxinus pennsylvanica]|uniref:DNA2/NAM7 helicase-like C-terminal domain-containing protein n=1 Tax=Fraxinus pennsylvanica TaxID=56036 RepID=A0AAD1ZJD4_9LAMI|nr:unnamed protein product [Fraxinus pennsylvanica]